MQAAIAQVPALAGLVNDPALVTNTSVTGLLIQFFTGNRDIVPSRLNRLHESSKGRNNNPSTEIVPATPEVSVGVILQDLANAGFVLADGFSYERRPEGDSKSSKTTHVVRFQFYPARAHKFNSEGKKKWVENILAPVFSTLAANAFWQVTAYNNVMASGSNAIGIKCNTRVPLFGPDGVTPLKRRLRDDKGRQTGDPVPLQPNKTLRVVDEHLSLV